MSTAADTPSDSFQPMERVRRLSDRVADEILASIRSQQLATGDKLPSERELGEQFQVSRTVIREATRTLAARGVIEARAGVGLAVARIEASSVAESMTLFIEGRGGIAYERVHEVREAIEVSVAGLAAERASDEEIAALAAAHAELAAMLERGEDISEADVEFHRALARMTHNELFVIMLDSIGDVLLEIRRRSWDTPGEAPKTLRHHKRILNAVSRHDPEAAAKAMEQHLTHAYRLWVRIGRPGGQLDASRPASATETAS